MKLHDRKYEASGYRTKNLCSVLGIDTCDRPLRTLPSIVPLDTCASILAVAWEMRSAACFRVLPLSFRPGSAWDSFRASSVRSCLLEGLCTFLDVPA